MMKDKLQNFKADNEIKIKLIEGEANLKEIWDSCWVVWGEQWNR